MNKLFKFYTPLKVRYNETDLQGHVNFGHYLFYFDVGVTDYLEAIGYSYQTMLADNTDFLYAEAHCNYKSSVKWPETLRIYTRIGYIGRRSLRFEFEARAEIDERLVATGHIAAVTADKNSFEPHPIPARMREAIVSYEDELSTADPA